MPGPTPTTSSDVSVKKRLLGALPWTKTYQMKQDELKRAKAAHDAGSTTSPPAPPATKIPTKPAASGTVGASSKKPDVPVPASSAPGSTKSKKEKTPTAAPPGDPAAAATKKTKKSKDVEPVDPGLASSDPTLASKHTATTVKRKKKIDKDVEPVVDPELAPSDPTAASKHTATTKKHKTKKDKDAEPDQQPAGPESVEEETCIADLKEAIRRFEKSKSASQLPHHAEFVQNLKDLSSELDEDLLARKKKIEAAADSHNEEPNYEPLLKTGATGVANHLYTMLQDLKQAKTKDDRIAAIQKFNTNSVKVSGYVKFKRAMLAAVLGAIGFVIGAAVGLVVATAILGPGGLTGAAIGGTFGAAIGVGLAVSITSFSMFNRPSPFNKSSKHTVAAGMQFADQDVPVETHHHKRRSTKA